MTPERRAEVVGDLRARARVCDFAGATDGAKKLHEAADALEAMGERLAKCGRALPCPNHVQPKSAEASMKERIEGLVANIETWQRSVHGALAGSAYERERLPDWLRFDLECLERDMLEALHGPSDPNREKETLAEVMKP